MGQFAVIGIGNFGFYLGRHLYEKGHEVVALDINKGQVQKIKDVVSQAVIADATDREALEITFTPACFRVSAAWTGVVTSAAWQWMEPSS